MANYTERNQLVSFYQSSASDKVIFATSNDVSSKFRGTYTNIQSSYLYTLDRSNKFGSIFSIFDTYSNYKSTLT